MLVVQKLYEQEYSQNILSEQLKGISIAKRYKQKPTIWQDTEAICTNEEFSMYQQHTE